MEFITAAAFRKGALSTWSVKPGKAGVRQMLRKNLTTNIGHAIVGISTEVGEVHQVAFDYILGIQNLHDAQLQHDLLDELSDVVYYTVVLAKFLKLPLPGTMRNPRPTKTPTAVLLHLHEISTQLLGKYKKVYYGQELDIEKIKPLAQLFIGLVWDACWLLINKPVAEVMQFNNEKLLTGPNARYKDGTFTTAAIVAKDKADAKANLKVKQAQVKKPVFKKPAPATKAKPTGKAKK